MNLITRIGISLGITVGLWLIEFLIHRRIANIVRSGGYTWPIEDIGVELSPGLIRAIAITDWLHFIRFQLLGAVFCLSFLSLSVLN